MYITVQRRKLKIINIKEMIKGHPDCWKGGATWNDSIPSILLRQIINEPTCEIAAYHPSCQNTLSRGVLRLQANIKQWIGKLALLLKKTEQLFDLIVFHMIAYVIFVQNVRMSFRIMSSYIGLVVNFVTTTELLNITCAL